MKINDILIQQLEEGPILNKFGTAVGKGVGSVADGIAGLGAAVKKGFAAGKQAVPAYGAGMSSAWQSRAKEIMSQSPKTTINAPIPSMDQDEPISIGGQKLDPNNPKDAEIIAKARAASK